ncbi:MAG: hypothetical protein P8M30_03755 [Planctomycetaceae bacterium]|nr:hypothetical protein [Planctomycetaceae bacterium]MDG2388418.1 hypothetical protein [Planctomycetaceae bacterium]
MHSSKLIFILLALLASQTVFAQDTALQNATTELTSDVSTSQSSDLDEEDEDLKKRKLEIGIILTAGIFLVGLFLVAVTLIYGRRTRRQIAAGRGPSQARDELWYLKHAKSQPAENESDETQEETK